MVPGGFAIDEQVVYLRYGGKSAAVAFALLGVSVSSTDQQVLEAAAKYLGVPMSQLNGYKVVRQPDGNMTVESSQVAA
jgi:hypothetical protein